MDLSLRASMLLLDRLYADVEVLRRQALAVPAESGRCQSAWMGAAGVRFQFRRGVFMSARYVGGQGDCVPSGSFQLNLAGAFGDGFMRIPTPDEVGWIKKWHALLMGMIDPILDCQGIMRADDGTPMFRFGYPDSRDPSIIRRNNVAYRVGEHFWQKDNNLYHEADLSHPVLDLHGESPLTFAERAAMHDCPTLPGLGSPCQVALNLAMLRHNVEQSDHPMQLVLNEDAQLLACLNHLSPVKAAAVFATLEHALGPLLSKLPQVQRWGHPTAPEAPKPSVAAGTPASVAGAPPLGPPSPVGGPLKVAAPTHPSPSGPGQHHRPARRHGAKKPADSDEPPLGLPHLPALPGGPSEEPSSAVADNTLPPPELAGPGSKPRPPAVAPESTPHTHGRTPPTPAIANNEPPRGRTNTTPQPKRGQERLPHGSPSDAPEHVAAASVSAGEQDNQKPEPTAPMCGTKCELVIGAAAVVATGVALGGGVEVLKDGLLLGAAEAGVSTSMSVAGAAGSAVVGTIVVDGVADHAMPPSAPAEPARPAPTPKPASSADSSASGQSSEVADPPKRGTFKGDLSRLQKEALSKTSSNRVGAQGELDAIERLLREGKNVEKLPERSISEQGDPDLLVDGELLEVKTREDPLSNSWIKEKIKDANGQIKTSNYGSSPEGSVELQLKNQPESDSRLLQRAEAQVRGQFKSDQSRSLTSVRLYNDGRLLGEWIRVGDKIVRVFSVVP